MDLQSIQQYLETEKDSTEVQGYLQGLKTPTLEGVQKFVSENDDAKKWFESQKHSHFDKGIETWKKNNLQKLVDDELVKRNPSETPEQKRIRELEDKFHLKERELLMKDIGIKARDLATQQGIPTEIVTYLINEDESKTTENIAFFKKVFDASIQKAVEDKVKASGIDPVLTNNEPPVDTSKMSMEEYALHRQSRK
ncbi:DUF4355 domain-containing protein [Brevibacillus laterosporus]|nr:DUF4355 domain-containing protein [Brevibacillus laterosporus]TPG71161.1 DUF4355 domain-containing protein [Brevibacillus laterosporus]